MILKIRPILFEEKQQSLFETIRVLDRESLIMRSKNQQDQAKKYKIINFYFFYTIDD